MLLFYATKQLLRRHLNLFSIKRSLIVINSNANIDNSFANKLLFNNNYLIICRLFCDKKLQTISAQKQQKQIEISVEKIPKTNKFSELILKKPKYLLIIFIFNLF